MIQQQGQPASIVISTKGRNLPKRADELVVSTMGHAEGQVTCTMQQTEEQLASTIEYTEEQVTRTMVHAEEQDSGTMKHADKPGTNNMLTNRGVRLGRFLPLVEMTILFGYFGGSRDNDKITSQWHA